jgi:hypothetical protein
MPPPLMLYYFLVDGREWCVGRERKDTETSSAKAALQTGIALLTPDVTSFCATVMPTLDEARDTLVRERYDQIV